MSETIENQKIYQYKYTDKRNGSSYICSKKYTPLRKYSISKTQIRNDFNDVIKIADDNDLIIISQILESIKLNK